MYTYCSLGHRDFHGYGIEGTTYGAYLLQTEDEVVLIDTVKAKFADEFMERISSIVKPEQITKLIVQHTEPDHGSALPAVLPKLPNATVICTD
ncbi:hypothetical protein KIPB_015852, partial [Kipferlia bialata]|eukprot:g15852.t1